MGYRTQMQQISAGSQFNGAAPVGAFVAANGKRTYPEGTVGGLFDMAISEPAHIMGVQLYGAGTTVLAGTQAVGVLTLTGQPLDTETVTIGTTVYTFQTSLTDVDGNVLIGASASDSLDNLIAAINLGAGAGTLYATATTANTDVTAAAGAGDTMDVTAIAGGTVGNAIDSTETLTNGSWGAVVLENGADDGIYTVSKLTVEGHEIDLFTGTGDALFVSNSGQRIPLLPGEKIQVVTSAMTGAMRCMVMTDIDQSGGSDG